MVNAPLMLTVRQILPVVLNMDIVEKIPSIVIKNNFVFTV